MNFSKVTIILATYNRAHLIEETLRSIQQQTYKNFECLVVDDGGTDHTRVVIQPYLNDNRFKYYKRSDAYQKGLPGSRNFGLDKAKGKYIIFFDDDDIIHPQNLETCITVFAQETTDFVAYQKISFSTVIPKFEKVEPLVKVERVASRSIIEEVVTQHRPLASCTVMWKKEAVGKERFSEALLYAEEWEFYTRLLSKELQGVFLNEVLYLNRKHPNSNTGEFYSGSPVRRQSKKQAILAVAQNLHQKDLLSKTIFYHLAGLAISYRDALLLAKLLDVSGVSFFRRKYYWLKYDLFGLYALKNKFNRKFNV